MKLGPLVARLQAQIKYQGRLAAKYRSDGLPIMAEITHMSRRESIAYLTEVLRMAEEEVTDSLKAIPKTQLDRLPF